MACCKKAFAPCEPVPACIKQLIIKTPFNNTLLTLKIIDKFKKSYSVKKTTDSTGLFIIQVQDDGILTADTPIALFNEFAGVFKIMMYKTSNNNEHWTINGVQVDALSIVFRNITPIVDTYTIDTTTGQGEISDFSMDFGTDFGF